MEQELSGRQSNQKPIESVYVSFSKVSLSNIFLIHANAADWMCSVKCSEGKK